MALATQCPFCQTAFRVAGDQLKLRDGLVRCGHCHEVFDGNAHLLADLPGDNNGGGNSNWPASPPSAPTIPTVITPAIARANAGAPNYGAPPTAPLPDADAMAQIEAAWDMPPPSPDEEPVAAMDDEAEQSYQIEQAPEETPSAVWRTAGTAGSARGDDDFDAVLLPMYQSSPPLDSASDEIDDTNDDENVGNMADADDDPDEETLIQQPEFILAAHRRQRRARVARVLMIVLSVILLLTAIGQGIYLERNRIAQAVPQLKPLLTAACQPLHCTVGLQRQIDQLSIESNELQAATAEQPALSLNLLLRNRADAAMAWPAIELTLNDDDENALIRRVFTPADYLPAGQTVEAGMAANTEQAVKLRFTLTQAVASGYRVYLFYP